MDRVCYLLKEARNAYPGSWSSRVVVLCRPWICMECEERIECLTTETLSPPSRYCQIKIEWFFLLKDDLHWNRAKLIEYLEVSFRYYNHNDIKRIIVKSSTQDIEFEFFIHTQGLTLEDFNQRVRR